MTLLMGLPLSLAGVSGEFLAHVLVGLSNFAIGFAKTMLILVIGWMIVKYLDLLIGRLLDKSKIDETVKTFISSAVSLGLKSILVITVIIRLGVERTSIAALLGAMGVGIGLALQGSLTNLAGGIVILIIKPFKVGHFIKVQDYMGTVKRISIFHTVLETIDTRTIFLPNGNLANSPISNFSINDVRQLDFTFGVSYDSSIEMVKEIINKILDSHDLILHDLGGRVRVKAHSESSIDFTVRAWTKAENYWPVTFDIYEQVKEEFDKAGISIPYPQVDVHLVSEK